MSLHSKIAAAMAAVKRIVSSARSGVERVASAARQGAAIVRWAMVGESVRLAGVYTVECRGADGRVKWRDSLPNLVTTVGKNDLLDKYLEGSSYTAAWYLGLIDNAGYTAVAAGDTAASHSGWTESTAYSNGTRPAPSWGAAAASSKASTPTAFNINATATIKGAFLISNSTKGGTSGILYSAGLFTGGDKAVANGDTLNVTYTASA